MTKFQHGVKLGGLVLDPMMGSGTTGEVALQLNRDFIGIEISEKYFNLAKERLTTLDLSAEK